MTRHGARRWALLLGALAIGGCTSLPDGPTVRLENMANTPAAVDVNGTWVGTYAGGTSADVYLSRYGQPPYTVTVRTPNGLIAAQLEVTTADLEAGADAPNIRAQAELDCGTIRVSFGQSAAPLSAIAVGGMPAC